MTKQSSIPWLRNIGNTTNKGRHSGARNYPKPEESSNRRYCGYHKPTTALPLTIMLLCPTMTGGRVAPLRIASATLDSRQVIPFLASTVIASAAKQSRSLKKLKDSISSSVKTGLPRHFVPRKDADVIGAQWWRQDTAATGLLPPRFARGRLISFLATTRRDCCGLVGITRDCFIPFRRKTTYENGRQDARATKCRPYGFFTMPPTTTGGKMSPQCFLQ